jgi:hypothetical protein
VRLWSAHSPTRDFRDARWTSQRCRRAQDGHSCAVDTDGAPYTAAFAELTFKDRGDPAFSFSTTVCIAPTPEDPAQPGC